MVGQVLGTRLHLSPHAKRILVVGLVSALAVLALLIAAVVMDLLPGIIFAALAVIGMALIIFGDLQRREVLRRRDAKHAAQHTGVKSVKEHVG